MNLNNDDNISTDLGRFLSQSIINNNSYKRLYLNDDNEANNTSSLKRKFTSDNPTQENEKATNSKLLSDQFSIFSGLNVQLVDKNDKKFIKLNLSNNNSQINKLKATQIADHNNLTKLKLAELDDLPSESDLSSGQTLFLPSMNKNTPPISSPLGYKRVYPVEREVSQNKTVSIYYKCNQCRLVFDNEVAFKSHQRVTCLQALNSQDENSSDLFAKITEPGNYTYSAVWCNRGLI
jgi:hypothetical protein